MTASVDFGIAWEWEYDAEFVALLERACRSRGLSTLLIDPGSLPSAEEGLRTGGLSFSVFFDRASDTNPAFLPLVAEVERSGSVFVNPPADVERAINKAVMHLDFSGRGIDVPYTIILPAFRENDPTEEILTLENVGIPFIVKPAHGGGGLGVLLGAKTPAEVLAARREFAHDQILIQENIVPRTIEGRRAWFRAYYVGGDTLLCWWDPVIHIYERVTPAEAERWGLGRLEEMARTIHEIARLNFFSTEIAVTETMRYVSVDYVNDQCDMRIKSKAWDGIPDDAVECVCASLAAFAGRAVQGRAAAGTACRPFPAEPPPAAGGATSFPCGPRP